MKKLIALIICIAGILPAFGQFALTNEISLSTTLTINPSHLSLSHVTYTPASIVTNTVHGWGAETNVVEVGGPLENYAVVTNTVRPAIIQTIITTNAEAWTCFVVYSPPKGHRFALGPKIVRLKRMETEEIDLQIRTDLVRAFLGDRYAGVAFSAMPSEGRYEPKGTAHDAFLGLAAKALDDLIKQTKGETP